MKILKPLLRLARSFSDTCIFNHNLILYNNDTIEGVGHGVKARDDGADNFLFIQYWCVVVKLGTKLTMRIG